MEGIKGEAEGIVTLILGGVGSMGRKDLLFPRLAVPCPQNREDGAGSPPERGRVSDLIFGPEADTPNSETSSSCIGRVGRVTAE